MILTYELLQEWFGDLKKGEECRLDFFGNFERRPNGCELWKGPFWDQGYGRYKVFRENRRVHRICWVWEKKQSIPAGLWVRHFMCDQKACANPAHLLLGNEPENGDDDELIHGGPIAFGPGFETGGEPTGRHCYHNLNSMRADPSPSKPDGILYAEPVPADIEAKVREALADETLEEWLRGAAEETRRRAPEERKPFKD